MLLIQYEDALIKRKELLQILEDTDGEKAHIYKQLSALNEFLHFQDDFIDDPLVAKWEAELEQGLIPDFNEGL